MKIYGNELGTIEEIGELDNKTLHVRELSLEDFEEHKEAKINHFISFLQKLIERKAELGKNN